jgi:hydroxyacylglutathione hydrolase
LPFDRQTFPVGPLGCNCSIVSCRDTGEALVVDPGDDADDILAALGRDGLTAITLVHTHAHFDHVMATGAVAAATGAEMVVHRDDRWLWDRALMQIEMFGVRRRDGQPWQPPPAPTRELEGGETIRFGRREARALHTPGHTPGSLCYFVESGGQNPIVFAGDTLFRRSIGRTDLWGGSSEAIAKSIQQRLLTLPDDTVVVAGHGPDTTIAAEREHNPFVGRAPR